MIKIADTRLKKILLLITGISVIVILAFILLVSPIAKHLIEKYDVKYTGRQVRTGWVYMNPITGYIHIKNFKIYESENSPELKDSTFFSAKGISINISLLKLLSKTMEISRFSLNEPKLKIIQDKNGFNFNDLIKKFSPAKEEEIKAKTSEMHFNFLKISIGNGEFHYQEKEIPISYFIKEVNLESKGKYWNSDTIAVKFSFRSGPGSGSLRGNVTLNLKNMDYRTTTVIRELDLQLIEQYFRDLANYGRIRASLNADLNAKGNLNDVEALTANGTLEINNFHFGKNKNEDYFSFDKFTLAIKELRPKLFIYKYDSISLSHPVIKYERYDYLDNIQRMFGKNGSNITAARADTLHFNLILEIADYVKNITRNLLKSNFIIDRLAVYNGVLEFSDYSLNEKFSLEINPLHIVADSIDRTKNDVNISLNSGIWPYGNMSASLSATNKDSNSFILKYQLQKLPLSLFNPYLVTYTSFPLDRGTLEFNGTLKVKNGAIQSTNHFLVIDPRVSERVKNKQWLPMPFLMYLTRERANVIDYEIPITGNLKDPKFKVNDIILDILKNIFVKPPSTPYLAQVKRTENIIEKSLTLKWNMNENELPRDQKRFLNKIADFMKKNPEASIEVYPMIYVKKEKENILFFEARKKYFLSTQKIKSLDKPDSLKVVKLSVKDSAFTRYINKQINDSMLFTIHEKCRKFVNQSVVEKKFNQLKEARKAAFMQPFEKEAVENRVKMYNSKDTIPYNGFSYYEIRYKGDIPDELIKAYRQINELNSEPPRKFFKKEREKSSSTL